jgi:hypothetical protein
MSKISTASRQVALMYTKFRFGRKKIFGQIIAYPVMDQVAMLGSRCGSVVK